MKNLKQQIDELNANLAKQLPQETLDAFGKSIQDLKAQNIESNSIGTGKRFPDFSLPNINSETISLNELLNLTTGKVIIAFFRGSWCPYCNLELKALQDNLKHITNKSATLVVISPQTPEHNQELKSTHHLGFELLTDKNNTLAKQLGISFKLKDDVTSVYNSLGIELAEYNENNNNELPVPAVFVVDKNYSITYKFVDINYMNRIDIKKMIEQL